MPWTTTLTHIAGRPALLLLDTRFEAAAPIPILPHLCWFGVSCRRPPDSAAFEHPDETPDLDRIERDLIALADEHAHGYAVYVCCLTTRGIREYYLYAGEHARLGEVLPHLHARHPDYRIGSEQSHDPEWTHYRTWLAAAAAGRPLPPPT